MYHEELEKLLVKQCLLLPNYLYLPYKDLEIIQYKKVNMIWNAKEVTKATFIDKEGR